MNPKCQNCSDEGWYWTVSGQDDLGEKTPCGCRETMLELEADNG